MSAGRLAIREHGSAAPLDDYGFVLFLHALAHTVGPIVVAALSMLRVAVSVRDG